MMPSGLLKFTTLLLFWIFLVSRIPNSNGVARSGYQNRLTQQQYERDQGLVENMLLSRRTQYQINQEQDIASELEERTRKEVGDEINRLFEIEKSRAHRELSSISTTAALSCSSFPSDEYQALKALYDSTSGATSWKWQQNTTQYGIPWNFTTSISNPSHNPCLERWQYLTCTIGTGSNSNICFIQKLIMQSVNLAGSIPYAFGSISSFPYLTTLQISGNSLLTGSIPISLGNFTALQILDLDTNSLTSSIPWSLNRLSSLTSLILRNNKLTGSLAPELFLSPLTSSATFAWPYLQTFYVASNLLSGSLPSEAFDAMKATSIPNSITTFYVQSNLLTGSLPANLSAMSQIYYLSFYSNHLSSSIAQVDWSLMPNIYYFYLQTNQFTGSLPDSVYYMRYVNSFYVSNNYFTGSLSPLVSNFQTLTRIILSTNYFTGSLPSDIGSMAPSYLYYFYPYVNMFSGSLPHSICQLTKLIAFNFNNNRFTGTLPNCIGQLTQLQYLYFYNNYFTGSLPNSVGNLTNMKYWYGFQNKLQGTLRVHC